MVVERSWRDRSMICYGVVPLIVGLVNYDDAVREDVRGLDS